MDKNEIIEIYTEEKRWEVTDVYCKDMLVAWNGNLSDLIRTCLDIFDMPAALVNIIRQPPPHDQKNSIFASRLLRES
jgi:hypothetical protein